MDNITHTMLGVGMAQSGLAKKYGKGTTLFMIIASNIPDLDIFWSMMGDGLSFLDRRMLTHSLVGAPLLALGLGALFRLKYKNISLKSFFYMGLLAMGVHIFFDVVNSYGTVFLYPFNRVRYELAWVFIIDLALWGLLFTPFLVRWATKKIWTDDRVFRGFMMGIVLYVGLCGVGRVRANILLDRTIQKSEMAPQFHYVFPEALGFHRFRGVIRTGEIYSFYLIHLLTGEVEKKMEYKTDANNPIVQQFKSLPEAQALLWFSKAPAWKVESPTLVRFFDFRFHSLVLPARGNFFTFGFGVVEGNPVFLGRLKPASRE